MSGIEPCELPQDAILRRYSRAKADHGGHSYTDCFSVKVNRPVSLPEFVFAFYTTPLFRVERSILGLLGRSSSDEQALQVAQGTGQTFAAWSVEDRLGDQLLMCDFRGRTRSWFMITDGDDESTTRLYFGSAVLPTVRSDGEKNEMSRAFRWLLGFHKLYSKMLLALAGKALSRANRQFPR